MCFTAVRRFDPGGYIKRPHSTKYKLVALHTRTLSLCTQVYTKPTPGNKT